MHIKVSQQIRPFSEKANLKSSTWACVVGQSHTRPSPPQKKTFLVVQEVLSRYPFWFKITWLLKTRCSCLKQITVMPFSSGLLCCLCYRLLRGTPHQLLYYIARKWERCSCPRLRHYIYMTVHVDQNTKCGILGFSLFKLLKCWTNFLTQ